MTDKEIRKRIGHAYIGSGIHQFWDIKKRVYLQSRSDGRGYRCITVDGKTYKRHTLICIIKNGPRKPGQIADHIDGDKTNDNPLNLEWVSKSENVRRAHASGRMAATKKRAVKCHRKELPNRWPSTSQAAKYFKCSPGTIASALTGKSKSARGYKWSYA